MTWWAWFMAGMVAGGFIGVFVAGLMAAASRGDEE